MPTLNKPHIRFPAISEFFLNQRLEESYNIIKQASSNTDKPLIIQFSGGKDSMAMLGLVREITTNFVCSFMQTGIEFPESIEFAKNSAKHFGIELLISTPQDHLGDFFQRLEKFQTFPTVRETWCNRDLKIRPQKKMLNRILGKGKLIKLVGVRRSESTRRQRIYKYGEFLRPDNQVGGDDNLYPILHWTDDDIMNYLKSQNLPTSSLYSKYGVSGCYWCPFYQASIYRLILKDQPNLYDEFIKWENIIGPSVSNYTYLKDLKAEVTKV